MPYSLRDYLEIDERAAIDQWRAVLARAPAPRQEAFRPIEVVLCFGLFRILDPRSFGGGNMNRLPEVVHRLAATLMRSPGSLTSKMLNLSFDRPHGGRNEPELFLRLGTEPDRFLGMYTTIVRAARTVGLGEDRVPDYLGPWQGTLLLGQDELGGREIELAWVEERDTTEVSTLRDWFGERTERLVEQRVRLGQHRFAAAVLEAFDNRCGFCGFSALGLAGHGMIVASHIKPWADCSTARERLDPRNGIAACPTHDRAFDTGLMTVNGGMRIHRAPDLEARLADRVTNAFFGTGVVADRLILGARGQKPNKSYLDYHRANVFDRAG